MRHGIDKFYTPSSAHDTEAEVEVDIRVRLPRHAVAEFALALTGHDDDVMLAAERAIRDRIDSEEVELDFARISHDDAVSLLMNEADIEARCQRTYGPPVEA